jgi:salicylate hydroxylase
VHEQHRQHRPGARAPHRQGLPARGDLKRAEDAAVLACELAAELDRAADVPAALRRYELRRRARTRQVQLMSRAASGALHLPDGPAARRRDAALARLVDDLAWIHGYDALAPPTGRGARYPAAAG